MRFNIIRLSAFLTIFSLAFPVNAQQSTATFELGELLIPSIRVGDEYYYNTRFINTRGLDFKVQALDQGSVTENPTAEYSDREQTIVIESLSYEGKPYRNAVFKVISGDSIRFISTEPAYADRASLIKLPSAAIPDPDNSFLTLQMVAAVDINQDGLKDLVAHLWHANWNHLPENAGEDFYGEVPNSLVIFLQTEGRTFEFANDLVLEDGISDLNGSASRKQVIADFNADGYPDIAYALNREDGRLMSLKDRDYGESNWGAKAAVLLSKGNGKYAISSPAPDEEALWYHGVAAVKNEQGYSDVLFRGKMGSGSSQPSLAYRMVDGLWEKVDEYPWLDGWDTQSVGNFIWATDGAEPELFSKSGKIWESVDKFSFQEKRGETARVKMFNADVFYNLPTYMFYDQLRTSFALSEQCIMDNGKYFVSAIDSRILPKNWKDLEFIEDTTMQRDSPLLVFTLEDGELKLREDLLPIQFPSLHSYRFDCTDVNHDGRDDIFVSNEDGSNALYLQSAEGVFEVQSLLIFPEEKSIESGPDQIRSIYDDLDGDGNFDLLYYSNAPSHMGDASEFEIYWGK
jgi:hypothetical protein